MLTEFMSVINPREVGEDDNTMESELSVEEEEEEEAADVPLDRSIHTNLRHRSDGHR